MRKTSFFGCFNAKNRFLLSIFDENSAGFYYYSDYLFRHSKFIIRYSKILHRFLYLPLSASLFHFTHYPLYCRRTDFKMIGHLAYGKALAPEFGNALLHFVA